LAGKCQNPGASCGHESGGLEASCSGLVALDRPIGRVPAAVNASLVRLAAFERRATLTR